MQVRHGKCNACGARYKLPASFAHDRAKCKQCGGIVEIGAPTEASTPTAKKGATPPVPAAKPAPTARDGGAKEERKAPSMKEKLVARRAADAAPESTEAEPPPRDATTPRPSAKTSPEGRGAKSGARGVTSRATSSRRGGATARRSGRTKDDGDGLGNEETSREGEKSGLPLPLILGGVTVVLVALVIFLFRGALFGGDEQTSAASEGPEDATPLATGPSLKERQEAEYNARMKFREAIRDALEAEGLTVQFVNDTKDYAANLKSSWLQELDSDFAAVTARFEAESLQPKLEAHLERIRAKKKEKQDAATAAATAREDALSNPDSVDLAQLAPLPRLAGTTEEEWAQMNEDLAKMLDPYSGAKGVRAQKALATMHRKAFPLVMNAFIKLDVSLNDDVKTGLSINQFLKQATGGSKSVGWKDGVEPTDQTFNKKVIRTWYGAVKVVLTDDSQWAGMLGVEIGDIPDPSGAGAADSEALDAALDELDID